MKICFWFWSSTNGNFSGLGPDPYSLHIRVSSGMLLNPHCSQWLWHGCVNVCMNSYCSDEQVSTLHGNLWMVTCVVKHIESSIRLDKLYINAFQLPFKTCGDLACIIYNDWCLLWCFLPQALDCFTAMLSHPVNRLRMAEIIGSKLNISKEKVFDKLFLTNILKTGGINAKHTMTTLIEMWKNVVFFYIKGIAQ